MKSRLAQVLFRYRITPQTTTGVSPSELLLGRRPRSRLDLLKPHTAERVEQKQLQQKRQHDARSAERSFDVGSTVFVRNYHHGNRWLSGTIQQQTGPVSFRVRLTDGRIRRCHQDQIRRRYVELPQESPTDPDTVSVPTAGSNNPPVTASRTDAATEAQTTSGNVTENEQSSDRTTTTTTTTATTPENAEDNSVPQETGKTYPTRVRNPVDRFEPTW